MDATRKDHSDSPPKQDPPRGLTMTLNEVTFQEIFESGIHEEVIARMDKGDRETLIKMCKVIATKNRRTYYGNVILCWQAVWDPEHNLNYMRDNRHIRVNLHIRDMFRARYSENNVTFDISFCSDDGRITSLRALGRDWWKQSFILPSAISGLDRLQDLEVDHCQLLPAKGLSKLPNLECLTVDLVNLVIDDSRMRPRMRLPHLKSLCIKVFRPPTAPKCDLYSWIDEQLPSLERLTFHQFDGSAVIADILSFNNSMRFPNKNLGSINFSNVGIDERQVETFLCDLLPNSPMITDLWLSNNNIKSFRSIGQRLSRECLANGGRLLHKPTLRTFFIVNNPVARLIGYRNYDTQEQRIDPEEVDAFCQILRAFPTIEKTGDGENGLQFDPRARCELLLNRAGRSLVKDDRANDNPIPLSVWPLILGRLNDPRKKGYFNFKHEDITDKRAVEFLDETEDPARRASVDTATGLFYLLRKGPVLFDDKFNCKNEAKMKGWVFVGKNAGQQGGSDGDGGTI